MDVQEAILSLARATTWDGGEGVVMTLIALLRERVPFEAGELGLLRSTGFSRWGLGGGPDPIAGDDLLQHLSRGGPSLRFHDLRESVAFPETRGLLIRGGFRSLLAFPISAEGGCPGGLVLAQEGAWGFAGAPMDGLRTLAGMAGLALDRALALTSLQKRLHSLSEKVRLGEVELGALRSKLAQVERHLAALRQEAEGERESRKNAQAALLESEARVETLRENCGRIESEAASLRAQIAGLKPRSAWTPEARRSAASPPPLASVPHPTTQG